MHYVIEEIHLFVCEPFWLLYFSVLVLLTFFWLQLLLTLVLPKPINHDQSFLLPAREIWVLMAEQLFQYLQPGFQNRCLFVCSDRKNTALIEMLDCCSMPPYQIIFLKFLTDYNFSLFRCQWNEIVFQFRFSTLPGCFEYCLIILACNPNLCRTCGVWVSLSLCYRFSMIFITGALTSPTVWCSIISIYTNINRDPQVISTGKSPTCLFKELPAFSDL